MCMSQDRLQWRRDGCFRCSEVVAEDSGCRQHPFEFDAREVGQSREGSFGFEAARIERVVGGNPIYKF